MGRTWLLERHRIVENHQRVGGDNLAVVALRVGRHEVVAEDVDADAAAQQPAAGVGPVEGNVVLAVADVGFHERSRSAAMSTMAPRPSSISTSRDRRSRVCKTLTISAFGRRLTKTTKRKPKRRSYWALRVATFSSSVSAARTARICAMSSSAERYGPPALTFSASGVEPSSASSIVVITFRGMSCRNRVRSATARDNVGPR